MQVNEHTNQKIRINPSVCEGHTARQWLGERRQGACWLGFFSPKRQGKQGYPQQTGVPLKQADLFEAVIISKVMQVMLDHARICMGQTLSTGQDLGLGCCGKDKHSRSKAAFCSLSTALPFSTEPINNSPRA